MYTHRLSGSLREKPAVSCVGQKNPFRTTTTSGLHRPSFVVVLLLVFRSVPTLLPSRQQMHSIKLTSDEQ